MIEERKNLWDYPEHIIKCITTNAIIKKNGELVMGRGIALQAKQKFPEVPIILGRWIRQHGQQLYYIAKYNIISFPTKHHWRNKSDINLIKQSCYALNNMINNHENSFAVLPRPGCSNGGLDWENEVKPIISQILSDRICVISL